MTLQSEIQLDAIANVPEQHRYLMVDSTGSLVKITKHMNRHYNRVNFKLDNELCFQVEKF
jgi:hypothetical protein